MMEIQSPKSELANRIEDALTASPYLPRQTVKIKASQGHVQLHGKVKTFYQKQMAQETLRRIDGVEQIDNHLEVLTS